MTAKTLLIIPGSADAAEAVKRAREIGLYTVVADENPEAPALAVADSVLIANPREPAEAVAAVERFSRKIRRIDGALDIGAQAPATLAALAQRLGVPGPAVECAALLSDRLAMRQRLSSAGIAVPGYQRVENAEALSRLAAGRNLIIRPVDGRGRAGMQYVATMRDMDRAFALARAHSPTERVLVEQYLAGPRIVTQSVIAGGRCITLAMCDVHLEPSERFAPFFVEKGSDLPSAQPAEIQVQIENMVARAAAVLGLGDGVVLAEFVLRDNAPLLVDMTMGLAGGALCTQEIPLGLGIDMIGIAIKLALGEPVTPAELDARHFAAVARRHVFSQPGRVMTVSGIDEARGIKGVADIAVMVKPGSTIAAAGETDPSVATILATGRTRGDAIAAADAALARIQIETA